MKIDQRTLDVLRKALTGADGASPRLSKMQLIQFFRDFGFDERYVHGAIPAPKAYVEERLNRLNGTPAMADCIEAIVDPRRFERTGFDPTALADRVNEALWWSGYRLIWDDDRYVVTRRGWSEVNLELRSALATIETDFGIGTSGETLRFVEEQAAKADARLRSRDFDGTITNARSLVEAVLLYLGCRLTGDELAYDGDLPKLYKRVRKAMNLDPEAYRELDTVQQLLRGLTSVVDGLAGMSNAMADRHARTRHPSEHHARLAVNAAKSLCSFLAASYAHQSRRSSCPTAKSQSGQPAADAHPVDGSVQV